jgi:hypothetical protein
LNDGKIEREGVMRGMPPEVFTIELLQYNIMAGLIGLGAD